MKASIIIPAYNEEERLGKTLENYSSFSEKQVKKGEIDYEILIVVNNSTDGTLEIAKEWNKKNKRIRYIDLKNGGKGYAVLEGFKDALNRNNDLIGFVDSDLATSAEEYWKLIRNIGNRDGIIANRHLKDSKVVPKFTFRRVAVARGFNFMVRTLMFLPYRDTQCGAKLFTKKTAKYVTENVVMSKWAFDVEILYRLNRAGFRLRENPTVWFDKDGSKINVKRDSIRMFLAVAQLRIINSPFKNLLKPFKPFIGIVWRLSQ